MGGGRYGGGATVLIKESKLNGLYLSDLWQ